MVCIICYVLVYMYTAAEPTDFIVGLTNTQPTEGSAPPSYTLCGQWSGPVPGGATVTLPCATGLSEFRYVIIIYPSSDILTLCELEVMVPGT